MQINNNINSIPFVFIIGRPRSGTTMLRSMLDAHPNVRIPLESAFIKNLFPKYGKIDKWNKKIILKFYHDLLKQPQFNLWTIDTHLLKLELLKMNENSKFQNACKIIYLNVVSFFEKLEIKILADKNPPYTLCISLLLKIFPDARFIYIVRDHRDNVLSMKSVDFERPWLTSLAYRWKYYNKKFLKAYHKDKSRFHIIKYEDLVRNPKNYLTQLCTFLSIEYTDGMIHYSRIKDEALKIYPQELIERYHKSLFEPVSPGKVEQWKTKMKAKDIRKCDLIVGKYAEMMGYERMYKKKNIFLYIYCLPGIVYGHLYYIIFDAATLLLPYKLREVFFRMLSGIFKPWWKKNYTVELDKSSLKKDQTTQE